MKVFLKSLVIVLLMTEPGHVNEYKVFDFTEAELSNLEVRKVRGAKNRTIYEIGVNETANLLKAIADNAASGL